MARLLSVNVGLPRDIEWQGRTVHTAVWKAPIHGKRMVRRLNIDGDGQGDLAGHGGEQRAVFVYQIESYHYWQTQLGRGDFVHGQFGENFTIDGLSDQSVCIGDRFRIGSALFEVSQPRVTCYRVGIRMNEPRMPVLLIAHGRPGFYFRVLEEGEVCAGDEIVQVPTGGERMTVFEISALLYKPGHPRGDLDRALHIPALSAGWRASFEALIEQQQKGTATGNAGLAPAAAALPAWNGFRPLRVAAKIYETPSVMSLVLEPVDHVALPDPLPGQFLVLRLKPGPDAPSLIRSYSLSSGSDPRRYRVSIKREPGGAAGAYVDDKLKAGDLVDVSAARGLFTLGPGEGPLVFLSAGIGVTPVLTMLYALAAAKSAREIWWLYGTRNGREHPFVQEVRQLLAGLPRCHSSISYSAPDPQDHEGRDFDRRGRLGIDVLDALGVPGEADFYLCGPPAFMSDLMAGLAARGVSASRIHTEIFGSAPTRLPGIAASPMRTPHMPDGPAASGPLVSFARSGLNVHWGPNFNSVLELAEACDIPTRWSCRSGVCHTCEMGLLAGAVSYLPAPVDAPAEGNVLICCSRPQSDIVIDL